MLRFSSWCLQLKDHRVRKSDDVSVVIRPFYVVFLFSPVVQESLCRAVFIVAASVHRNLLFNTTGLVHFLSSKR